MSVSPKGKNEEPSIYIPNSGTNGSHDISIFIIWSKVHTDFPEGWTDVHSYQQGTMPSLSIQIFSSSSCFSISQYDWCAIEYQCGFNLHFFDG